MVYTDQGQKLTDPGHITTEIKRFYNSLLGTAAVKLPKAGLPTPRPGFRLSNEAAQYLCGPVATTEIDASLH